MWLRNAHLASADERWHARCNEGGINNTTTMKNTLSILALSATAGAVLMKLSNASFFAAVPGELVIAAGASLAIVGLMIGDYRRFVRPLAVPASVVRPAASSVARTQRTNAYGIRRQSAIVERAA
ncbi:MAG: hypothetical protein C0518_07490 [Opitutus sp.]|nr:hypothetical protein [Opitutus sp.]